MTAFWSDAARNSFGPSQPIQTRRLRTFGGIHATNNTTETMNELVTHLILSAIDTDKIPLFYRLDDADKHNGNFRIILKSGTKVKITVEIEQP